jgi:hypothetical protein
MSTTTTAATALAGTGAADIAADRKPGYYINFNCSHSP